MSASALRQVCANQAHDAERIGDADRIAYWLTRADEQQHTNP